MQIFLLKIKVFFIILLSLIFTGEEIAKDTTCITFKKYAKFYYNFPYHTFFSFPGLVDSKKFEEERTGNFDFFRSLKIQDGSPEKRFLAYIFLFGICTYQSFSKGKKARGFFFLLSSISNVLSAVFIPQYVFLIGEYGPCKNLLRLNLETGFYLSTVPGGLDVLKLKSVPAQDLDKRIADKISYDDDECSVCLAKLGKKDITTVLSCEGIKNDSCKYHCFHTNCLAPWLAAGNKTCPICRCPVNLESYCFKIKERRQDCMKDAVNDDYSLNLFFTKRNFFSVMIYADTTLCVDNLDDILNKESTLYWFVEFIFLRLGVQLETPSFSYYVHPFIGFCGISIRFLNIFAFSLVPTYMIRDTSLIYPGKMLLDAQLSFTWNFFS